jgi:hypothetical protein
VTIGVTCPCPIAEYVFSAIVEAKLELSTAQIIACSSGRCTAAEGSTTEVGKIRLRPRTIANRDGRRIFLFSIAAYNYLGRLFNFDFQFNIGNFEVA